jgi:transcriptional regulator with XRE-family HTH domain
MNIKIQFGLKIKHLRTQKGWSQETLAHKADIDRTYVPGIEAGRRNVSIVIIQKLANAFDIEVTELLNFKNIVK